MFHLPYSLKIILILGISLSMHSYAKPNEAIGKEQFDINCQACHAADKLTVGPSLHYIAEQYPAAKSADFLAWVKKPGRKNPDTIQMPAMIHLSEDYILSIHAYILASMKITTPSSAIKKDDAKHAKHAKHANDANEKPSPKTRPEQARPYVRRIFLPETSPVSIAVMLTDRLGIAWDTTSCRVRYAWPGTTDFFDGYYKENISNKIFYRETAGNYLSFSENLKPEFKGYELINGTPQFICQYGDTTTYEHIVPAMGFNGFIRILKIDNLKSPLTIHLDHTGDATVTSTTHSIQDNSLAVPASPTQEIQLQVIFP